MGESHNKRMNRRWSRLDNTAKIFPSTVDKTDTRVFRISCELKEKIDPDLLQQAVDRAVKGFPNFLCIMKKGMFWYYLEQCNLEPLVREEYKEVCAPLYEQDRKTLLFEVTYFRNKINLEMFHVIADGTGGVQFFRSIVYDYLSLAHPEQFQEEQKLLDLEGSVTERASDGFEQYYDKSYKKKEESAKSDETEAPQKPLKKAYRFHGTRTEDDVLRIIDGIVSVQEVKEVAKRYHTNLTVFLIAVYIQALHQTMRIREMQLPVAVSIPVNLRQFFPSDTTKNFFGMMSVVYNFSESSAELPDIIQAVEETFQRELTKEKMRERMNKMMKLENILVVRVAPLFLKNPVLRYARKISNRKESTVFSNVGRIDMPENCVPYIQGFDVYMSTWNVQLTLCSFGDRMQLGFTSAYESADIQKNFFRILSSEGITAQVRCNGFFQEEADVVEKQVEEAPKPKRKRTRVKEV